MTAGPFHRAAPFAAVLAASALGACRAAVQTVAVPAEAEAASLFGTPLVPVALSPEARAALEARLAEARAAYDSAPARNPPPFCARAAAITAGQPA